MLHVVRCVLHVACCMLRVACCVLSCHRRLTESSRLSARTVVSAVTAAATRSAWRSPGADVGGVSAVPAQMRQGRSAQMWRTSESRRRCGRMSESRLKLWENERVSAQMWLCRCGRPAPPSMLRGCRRRMRSASSSRITAPRTWRSSSHSARSPSLQAPSPHSRADRLRRRDSVVSP